MPVEQKSNEIYYVKDGFGHESWHFASADSAAVKAHKYHFWGTQGLQKELKEAPRVVSAPTVIGNVVCLDEACCNFAGVPKGIAQRLVEERVKITRAI